MDKNHEIVVKLAKVNQKWFREDELDKLGANYYDREDLVRKGFLKIDKTESYPAWKFFLTDSAYMFIVAMNTEKASEETRKLTFVMLIFTGVLIILTLVQIYLILTRK